MTDLAKEMGVRNINLNRCPLAPVTGRLDDVTGTPRSVRAQDLA